MSRHIFIFSLGPVQSFVSEARKAQDLFAGSALLGSLSQVGRNSLPEGWKIIFPAQTAGVLNRFVAISTDSHNPDQLQQIGTNVEMAVREALTAHWTRSLNDLGLEDIPGNWHQSGNAQLEELLEIHWIFYPFQKGEFFQEYRQAEKALAANKNIRPFSQNAEAGRKCILDGKRNVLFYKRAFSDWEKNNADLIAKKLFNEDVLVFGPGERKEGQKVKGIGDGIIAPGEGLSAVGLLKRAFKPLDGNGFESTTQVALQHLFNEGSDDFKTKLDSYLKRVKNEYQFLYQDTLVESRLLKEGFPDLAEEKVRKDLENELKSLEALAKAEGQPWPKYYALLIFDGDSMGEWFSGRETDGTPRIEPDLLTEFQEFLSGRLGEFARHCRDFIDAGRGKTVYAGGDDFLGFINLPHLFEALGSIREGLDSIVNAALETEGEKFGLKVTKKVSISGGLILAQFRYPLSEVLAQARQLEGLAKNVPGKNSLALGALRGTGNLIKTAWPWNAISSSMALPELLELITTAFKEEFSDNFFRVLYQTFRFSPEDEEQAIRQKQDPIPANIFEHELKRLLMRSYKIERAEGQSQEEFKKQRNDAVKKLETEILTLQKFRDCKSINMLTTLALCEFIHRNIHVHEND